MVLFEIFVQLHALEWTFLFILMINLLGFEVVDKGCCGSWLIKGAILCNSFSSLCEDREKESILGQLSSHRKGVPHNSYTTIRKIDLQVLLIRLVLL